MTLRSGPCCGVGQFCFCCFKPHWRLHWPHASPCCTVTINLFFCGFFLPSCFVLLLLPDSAPVCSALMTMSVLTSSSSSSSSCFAFILFQLPVILFIFSHRSIFACSSIFSSFYPPPPFYSFYFCFLALLLLLLPFSPLGSSLLLLLFFWTLPLCFLISPFSSCPWPFYFLHPSFITSLCSPLPLFFLSTVGPEQRRLKVRLFLSFHSKNSSSHLDFHPERNDPFLFLSVSNIDHVVLDEDHSGSRRLQNLWR